MNSKRIEDYILETEQNLKVAASVVKAWSQARHRLVTQFLTQLEQSVRKKLNGWSFERWGRYFDDSYPGFYIWKPSWKGEYCVNLECGNHGQKMVFGIWRDEQVVNGRPFSEAILSAVKQHFPSARAQKWWEAEITLHSPASDWREPDVLWRMYTDQNFLKEVSEQLCEVALVSERVVDRLIKKL